MNQTDEKGNPLTHWGGKAVQATPRTDALFKELVGRGCDFTYQANQMDRHARTLERELAAAEQRAEAMRKDAERYRVYRLYQTSGRWPSELRGDGPGLLAWSGGSAGKPYSGEVIDNMMDELLNSKYSRSIIDAAMSKEKK